MKSVKNLFFLLVLMVVMVTLEADGHYPVYHFRPKANWINDPNGPMVYNGIYHIFYQYNPLGPVFGLRHMVWGHSISKDLVNWKAVEPALLNSEPYDVYGAWSGSATVLPEKGPVILYTGVDKNNIQTTNYAVPSNLSDPYLRVWKKSKQNPIMTPDETMNKTTFRDPTTAWMGKDGHWRVVVGSIRRNRGMVYLFRSKGFLKWIKSKHPLHSKAGTGNWECPDFYPVAKSGEEGLDMIRMGDPDVGYVLKISLQDDGFDTYTIGSYDVKRDRYLPQPNSIDGSKGLRVDYGNFYASKSFFDYKTDRRILWGWSFELDSRKDDIKKGWAGILAVPRTLWLDRGGKQLIFWPIQEIEKLRGKHFQIKNKKLELGNTIEITGITAAQADVEVTFSLGSLKKAEPFNSSWTNPEKLCAIKDSTIQGSVGPFGLITLATSDLQEYTPVFFRVFKRPNDKPVVLMCSDATRSSNYKGIYKPSFGGFVDTDLSDDKISLRSLIDHSVVESFGAKGKTCITSRIYPEKAVLRNAHLYVFNNGTEPVTIDTLSAWDMKRPRKMNN